METVADWLIRLAGVYLGTGLVFSVPFVLRGVNRIDSVAAQSTWGFRLIIVPGVIAFWPRLLRRWISGSPPPRERNAHRDAAAGSPS